jgi:hypothetical protein
MINYNIDELKSALQKAIRRCDTTSIYWAKKLYEIPYQIPNLWNRLIIISSEDVGVACHDVTAYVGDQYKKFHDIENKYNISTKNRYEQRYILINTVHYLTKQNKSRLCSNVNHAYFKDMQPHIRGNMKKCFREALINKDRDKALKYAANLFKQNQEDFLIDELESPHSQTTDYLVMYFRQFTKVNRNASNVLFLVHLILLRTMALTKIKPNVQVNELTYEYIDELFNSSNELPLPNYAFDKHTKQGCKMCRGVQHFYEIGALLKQCYILDPFESIAKELNRAGEQDIIWDRFGA